MDADPLIPPLSDAGDLITVVADGPSVVVEVRGDIDAVAAPELRAALLAVLDTGPEAVRIDMAGVDFLDSVGISVLVTAYNRAEETGARFELSSVPASSLRVLEITRLTEVFTIRD